MRAYVLDKTLSPANSYGILIAKVSVHPDDNESTKSQSISYSQTTSNLERQTSVATNAGGGVPGIFKFDTSFTNAIATAERTRSVWVYFQASQKIPKARVSIEREDISLDPLLVTKFRKAATEGDAEGLLDILRDCGQFVPTVLVLGGRFTLHTSAELDDESAFRSTEMKLQATTDARFEVESVPVSAGGSVGAGIWDKYETSIAKQAKELHMEIRGGTESLQSTEPGKMGGMWTDSVGPFLRWRTIGFAPNSLIPITDFLEKDLKAQCIALLRAYFSKKLRLARTGIAGSEADDIYGPDNAILRRVKRITDIVVATE
ncbi:hypothetical protein [Paracoccus sp. PAR01]|uniref:hypothetical protein n=1 Tax=Paracoccus sp. PAR01 TaxID=2769282 RepID=UPI001786779A|nr:hypothetical protein [Paracoccus sp. PAR01]MBD9528734.1 hypothetical protein [Paracoccus sp. PAR01]